MPAVVTAANEVRSLDSADRAGYRACALVAPIPECR